MVKRKKIILAAVIIIVVLAIFLVLIRVSLSSIIKIKITPPTHPGPMSLSFNVYAEGFATYDNARNISPYAAFNYTATNAINMSVDLRTYARNPVPSIYLLNASAYCYRCYNEVTLKDQLYDDLEQYNLINNNFFYVPAAALGTVSNSIIIIPTGLMPIALLPYTQYTMQNVTITELLKRGNTVVYIGGNFSESIGPTGIVFKTPQASLLNLSALGLLPAPYTLTKNVTNLFFSNATFAFYNKNGSIVSSKYNSVTYVNFENGTIVAFSNNQKAGWKNATAIASDISRVINSHFWLNVLANYTEIVPLANNSTSGSLGVAETDTSIGYAQNDKELNNTYTLLTLLLRNSTQTLEENKLISITYSQNGTLGFPSIISETKMIPITVEMNVNTTKPITVSPHIDIFTSTMNYVMTIPVGFFNTSTDINVIKQYSFSIKSGQYIGILRNFYNRYYSSAVFTIGNTSLEPISMNFKNGTFVFSAESDNYSITNTTYTVMLDGGYKETGTVTNGTIVYALPKGTVVGYGKHVFVFTLFGENYTYSTNYVQKIFHIPIIYIEVIVVLVAIVLLNLIVKPPNRDEYYIDVAESIPTKKEEVTVGRDEILNVFDKVNYYNHWRYMPLTVDEVKMGISTNLRYNNMPISITTQNAMNILNKLVASGNLQTYIGYYAPVKWTTDSGYSVAYLAIFRKLRDYCITHGIMFTELGKSENADMVITKGGVQARIIIYVDNTQIKDIIVDSSVKTFIVFADELKKTEFTEKLYLSYGDQAELLRMSISNGYVKLIDTYNLNQLSL